MNSRWIVCPNCDQGETLELKDPWHIFVEGEIVIEEASCNRCGHKWSVDSNTES